MAKIKKIIKKIVLFPQNAFLFLRDLKKMDSNEPIENLVEKALTSQGGIIKPIQVKKEIVELLKLVKRKKPKIILEIGTASGGTLFLFSRVAPKNALIISVDMPGGHFGGISSPMKVPFYKSFAYGKQKIQLIRKDSHKLSTFNKVKSILKGRKIDFMFIDGDHTYEGVKKDFEMYSTLVDRSGFIALHDIALHPKESGCNVKHFWDSLPKKKKEIIGDEKQGWGGIGVIKLKDFISNENTPNIGLKGAKKYEKAKKT